MVTFPLIEPFEKGPVHGHTRQVPTLVRSRSRNQMIISARLIFLIGLQGHYFRQHWLNASIHLYFLPMVWEFRIKTELREECPQAVAVESQSQY
jgi:hypothetical protein